MNFTSLEKLNNTVKKFTLTEKVVFYFLAALLVLSAAKLLSIINDSVSVVVPARGGSLREGVIGLPRFINPILSISDADRDLTSLVYSGLMKASSKEELGPDLAESYQISDNRLEYTFKIKNNVFFHDNEPVTADDVIFTVQLAQNPSLKSPKRADWEGVTVEKIDEKTIRFHLKQPYAPFLENTTMGILPKHIWKNIAADEFPFSRWNTEPVGSGPFRIYAIKGDQTGAPTEYQLVPFDKYALGKPFLDEIVIRFYSSEKNLVDAYRRGEIEGTSGISPEDANILQKAGVKVERIVLPRVFGVFFNQNQSSVLALKEVRQALEASVDRENIVKEVLGGYGNAIEGPIPYGTIKTTTGETGESVSKNARIEKAKEILTDNGWKWNGAEKAMEKKVGKDKKLLAFSISTSNAPELKKTGELIQAAWEKIGAKVTLKVFEIGDLNQTVIRTRKYDSLLFGEIVGRDLDLFAFWHSSQRNDPGLNIAMYTNSRADKLLEEARVAINRDVREEKYSKFEEEIKKDIPAVFIYSPDFLYILPDKIQGFTAFNVNTPSERFQNIAKWYIETEKVWKIFASLQTV